MSTKRFFAAAAMFAVSALTLAGCAVSTVAGSGEAGGDTVTYTGWGGVSQESATMAWLEPYQEETGIEVVQDSPTDYSKIQQMAEAGNSTWDVVQIGADIGIYDGDFLEPIDCEIVACDDFDGEFAAEKYGVPLFVFAIVMTYNTDSVGSDAPTTWADYYDTEKYPGTRAMYGNGGEMNGAYEAALVADGVAQDDLYPLDVDRALEKMSTIKDDIIFYTDFAECIRLVSSGEAVMGDCYSGRVQTAIAEGEPLGFSWSQQVQVSEYLVVPKGSAHVEEAMKLIAYISSSENNGRFSEYMAYGPANPHAEVSAESEPNLPTAHILTGDDAPIFPDHEWYIENVKDADRKLAEWKES
ncbi:ABC transporter substrate-binding protein [Pseudoclavibacter terrae]|uniref:ABC transporter substrate-binding protein n=1 Tax=Pseudoclavibacter terrae TaxID=1530195 RepID=UPI00232CC69B|nr:ABC transporter substrate-binding protein [Pseudoclavibacter terrae]